MAVFGTFSGFFLCVPGYFFFSCANLFGMSVKEKDAILKLLQDSGVSFQLLEHEPVFTSEQAAKVRGVSLKQGIKAMVLQSNSKKFFLFCLSADKKIDFKKAAELVNEKRLFLASPQSVLQKTGCEIGSVSPFSGILSSIPTFFDNEILENETVEFNIGLHTHSVRMKSADLLRLIEPRSRRFVLE